MKGRKTIDSFFIGDECMYCNCSCMLHPSIVRVCLFFLVVAITAPRNGKEWLPWCSFTSGLKSRSRIRWVEIFPRQVLPGSSGDEPSSVVSIDCSMVYRRFVVPVRLHYLETSMAARSVSRPHTITSRFRDVHRFFISRADGLDLGIGARLLM